MAFVTVKKILRNRSVVVVGSAPLSPTEQELISNADRLVAVNGAIGQLPRNPDLWVLNSRSYDDTLYNDPDRWPESRKQLHEEMLKQGASKHLRHIVFIRKTNTSEQTIKKLLDQGTTFRAYTDIWAGKRMDLVRELSGVDWHIASNISAGLTAAVLAIHCKAQRIELVGFSFKNDYSYLSDVPPDTRKHIDQDKECLRNLMQRYSNLHIQPHVEAAFV